ncbi:MAG TPA: efflux transporter outer membrane subunit [Steroidobacteraceae bacterium]|jgi:NodT family efflux transporter outer membrane factor (OMF) lipoprotein|nr:efflux transporter outer membrane subunit [Steroidobacteraceae bacterium]
MRPPASGPALLTVLLAGCSLAPHYERPPVPPPQAAYKEAGDWKVAAPADTSPRGPWWTMFQDDDLNGLEAQVTSANQNLRAALASLEEARAQTRIARSSWFPTLTADAAATRSRVSINSPSFAPGKSPTYNLFTAQADLSYELDLFGRIRNTVANARYSEQATAGDVAALDLAVHAELATDYFTLRGLDAEQQLLDQTVADYARALALTQNLYKGGAAAISDVQQAQSQLETARTQAEDTRLRRAQTEHAIAVLVGREASSFELAARPAAQLPAPPVIDPGLPSQLLERRPDVAAAERRVAAANANIGVARAAYFPVFSLFANAGVQSTNSATWLSAPSQFWAIGPQAVLTLFNGGLHRAQSQAAHAIYDQQVANYRNTVLTAFEDVEDNLAALRQLQLESVSEAAAVKATQGALDQANLRYKGGIVTYLEVVTTENAALAARLSAADIEIRRASAAVLLVKALGGDWKEPPPYTASVNP